jgi:uncharacterized membrane protein YbaN (DUF454 family)
LTDTPTTRLSKTVAGRTIWFVIGWIAVVLAVAGAILPLLPTTPFLLVAALAFSRSSERWRQWIYNQEVFGPMLIAWERHGVIPMIGKVTAVGAMIMSFSVLTFSGKLPIWALALIGITLAAVAAFILTRPSRPPVEPAALPDTTP